METKQPRTIFDAINENIVNLSEDMNTMHCKVDDILSKIDVIYTSLVAMQDEPNTIGVHPAEEEIDSEKLNAIRENMIDTDPMYILFTSGSTGNPKGTVITHKSVIAYANWYKETFDILNYIMHADEPTMDVR